MSMLTKISIIPMNTSNNSVWTGEHYASIVCDEIKSQEAEGWYLRGTPEFLKCYSALMLTFEKEKTADDLPKECKQTESNVLPMTKDEICRLMEISSK